jgi:hypothetical protein
MQRSLLGEARVICLRRMFRYSTAFLVSLLIVCSVRPRGKIKEQPFDNPIIVFDRLARESGAEAFFPTTKKSLEQVKKTYRGISEQAIVPWTRLSAKQVQQNSTAGIKLTVECPATKSRCLWTTSKWGRVRDATYESGYIGFISLGTGHAVFRNLHAEGTR